MRLECRPTRQNALGLLVVRAFVAALGVWMIAVGQPVVSAAGYGLAITFGLLVLVSAAGLLRDEPVVVLDDEGVEDRRWRTGPVPWRAVTAVRVRQGWRLSVLELVVADAEQRLAALPPVRGWLTRLKRVTGRPPFAIDFRGLEPSLPEALTFIERVTQAR